MRDHYNIILFDGSYFLYRNQSIGRGNLSPHKLAGSFIQSVVKLVRESGITFDVGFLAFDKKPYHRTEILKGKYKDSREDFSEIDVAVQEDIVKKSYGDELVKAKALLEHMKETRKQLKIRLDAIEILKNLDKFGLTTLSYAGYEADDIARIITSVYSDKYSILLVSIDSDWVGLVNDNVDYLRCRHNNKKDFYNIETIKGYPDYISMRDDGLEEMGLAWYLQILEAMGVGHNDMRRCWMSERPVTIGEVVAEWEDLTKLRDLYGFDAETFMRQVSTFEISKFPDYDKVVESIKHINYKLEDKSQFNSKFIYELCTGIWINYYKQLYERICNYSLLQL